MTCRCLDTVHCCRPLAASALSMHMQHMVPCMDSQEMAGVLATSVVRDDCCVQATALTLLAFATLAYHPGQAALEAVTQAMREHIADYDPQAISNSIWALAIMGALPSPLYNLLVKAFVDQLGPLDEATGQLPTHVASVLHFSAGLASVCCWLRPLWKPVWLAGAVSGLHFCMQPRSLQYKLDDSRQVTQHTQVQVSISTSDPAAGADQTQSSSICS